jgi:YggT family protein
MFLRTFVSLLFQILQFAVLLRVIMSWVSPYPNYNNPIMSIIWQVTEPILAPIRRFATFGMVDMSPFIALIGLQVIESFIMRFLSGV